MRGFLPIVTARTLRFICSIFFTTRVALFAVAVFAVLRMPIDAIEARGFHLPPQPHAFLEAWARYDACWYVFIAEHGYHGPIGPYGDMRANFFPLFPALMTAVNLVARAPLLAGLIVSNAAYLVFLVLLWKIVRLDWSADVARRALWIYLLFPSTFFLSGAYSESVLLAAAAGALLAARRRHWAMAGLLAAFATLTRAVGIVAVVPLVAEYITTRHTSSEDTPSRIALLQVLAPPLLAAAGYLVFSAAAFGDPLATVAGQAAIRGPMAAPWQPFIDLWSAGPRWHTFDNSIVDAVLALVAVAAVPAIYAYVRPSYAWYALFIVLIPLSGSLMSFNRLLLPSFPHAILLARLTKRRWAIAALLIPCAILEAFLMAAFATWHWVA
jgi:hypothetical protein